MAAGLGFKDFTTGEVLTAADVDGYLMQGIWVFASAAARDAAVTSPQEGNFAFLKDTNTTTYYTGSAWTNLDTTGMVNPMTTTGDTIYSSSGSTPARLGIGTAGQVLQVNSGATAPEWATPASGGGYTELATGTLSGASVTISGISGSYKDLILYVYDYVISSTGGMTFFRINGSSSANYRSTGVVMEGSAGTAVYTNDGGGEEPFTGYGGNTTQQDQHTTCIFYDYANTAAAKNYQVIGTSYNSSNSRYSVKNGSGTFQTTSAITSLAIHTNANSFTAGTYYLYGVK